MDQRTRELVQSKGVIGGIAAYITAPPEGERYTPLDRVVTVISRVTMFLIFAGVLVTFYEVAMRYIFGSPTLWVNELVLWMGSIVYLAAGAYTMQRRAHIRITAIYDIVPKNVRRAFDYTALIVLAVYATLMLVGGSDVAWKAFITWERFGTIFDPPIPATIKPLVLIVTALVAAQSLNNILVDWFGRGKPGTAAAEEDDGS